jgi:hypothetical protein
VASSTDVIPPALAAVSILLLCACASQPLPSTHSSKSEVSSIVGVWRVEQFCDIDDASGKVSEPFGPHPIGYFIYLPTGQLSIQVMDPSPHAADVKPKYFGYFGTYTVDAKTSTVVHHVQGGTIMDYIGTDQVRRYRISGDTLSIGDTPLPCRVLRRAP